MGVDVTAIPQNVFSWEINCLIMCLFIKEWRFIDRSRFELFIYENIRIEMITRIVGGEFLLETFTDILSDADEVIPSLEYGYSFTFTGDINTNELSSGHGNIPLEIQPDMEEHGMYGHEGDYNFALNFIGPLLIECGYPIKEKLVYDFLSECLHPSVERYLKNSMDTPRSLKVCCRNVLRQTFRGKTLHKFVENPIIPGSIRDYVLLKPILKCLDTDKLKNEEIVNIKARNYIDNQRLLNECISKCN